MVRVVWASPGGVRPEHVKLLDPVELARRERYLRDEDRDRFTMGVTVTRIVLGEWLGLSPEQVPIDRACTDCGKPHGAPKVAGGPYVSVSHSGDRVGVAFSAGGPIGLDVEERRTRATDIQRHVLSPEEAERHPGSLHLDELIAYWTRKEAVLKATGDGLRVPMTTVTVTPPDQPPRLLGWSEKPGIAARMTLHPLDPGPAHLACLALIDQPDASVQEEPFY